MPFKSNQRRKTGRGDGVEAERVRRRLGAFIAEQSKTWNELKQRFSSGVTHHELLNITNLAVMKYNDHVQNQNKAKTEKIKVERLATRDNRVLILWLEENWPRLEPFLNKITLCDKKFVIIDGEREENEKRKTEKKFLE